MRAGSMLMGSSGGATHKPGARLLWQCNSSACKVLGAAPGGPGGETHIPVNVRKHEVGGELWEGLSLSGGGGVEQWDEDSVSGIWGQQLCRWKRRGGGGRTGGEPTGLARAGGLGGSFPPLYPSVCTFASCRGRLASIAPTWVSGESSPGRPHPAQVP